MSDRHLLHFSMHFRKYTLKKYDLTSDLLQVYDYGFSPHRGEGFKLAIHHHMDQPIMALSDVDISPGFVTQLSVTPTLTVTTQEALNRFTPDERACYADHEFRFKYLPQELYRYSFLIQDCPLCYLPAFRYGLSNCLFAATYDKVVSNCSCVPFFHTMAYEDYPKICSGTGLLCMNQILTDIGSHTHVNDVNGVYKQCYSPCTDQVNNNKLPKYARSGMESHKAL